MIKRKTNQNLYKIKVDETEIDNQKKSILQQLHLKKVVGLKFHFEKSDSSLRFYLTHKQAAELKNAGFKLWIYKLQNNKQWFEI